MNKKAWEITYLSILHELANILLLIIISIDASEDHLTGANYETAAWKLLLSGILEAVLESWLVYKTINLLLPTLVSLGFDHNIHHLRVIKRPNS